MVEYVAGHAVAVAAQEPEPRSGHGNGEGEGIGVRARQERRAGIDEEFVGEGGEGGEDPRPSHDNAVRRLFHLVESDLVPRARHVAARLVDGGLHDGVGEGEITPRRLLLEGD